jgi:glycosyltransferase involved in cell wall biosynthesis
MHVLIIPSELYLPSWRHTSGIFQSQSAGALSRCGHEVGVLSVGFITAPQFTHALRAAAGNRLAMQAPPKAHIERCWIPLPVPYSWLFPWGARAVLEKAAAYLFTRYVEQCGLPDLIHAHDPLWAGWLGNFLGRRHQLPVLHTVHTSLFLRGLATPTEIGLSKQVLTAAGCVTAVSSALANSLTRDLGIARPELLSNVVEQEFLDNPRVARDAEHTVFLSIGSLDRNKDHASLLEAFALAFRGTTARLRIAGTGPEREPLVRRCSALGIGAQVSFLGQLDRRAVLAELGRADCLVHPSRSETFGVVLIEALASGVPVVATRSGGPEDIVTPDTGCLVPPGDPPALARAMQEVCGSPERFPPEHLRGAITRRFGAQAYATRLERLMEQTKSAGVAAA